VILLSPVQVIAQPPSFNVAPLPFPTLEDLLYDTYSDLQMSIMRLGEYFKVEYGPMEDQLWSFHHEFRLDNTPHIKWLFRYKILKVYAQVKTTNGKPSFHILLEEIEFKGSIENVHHVFMEDNNLNSLPDVISENWVVIEKKGGHRYLKDMKTQNDPEKGKDRIDKRWNFWFAYWIRIQITEFKETFKNIPDPRHKREV